tara:strand:- start:3856 stop:4806 length:951 start_codon:yes stop_codon:yes gene_type:complete
MYKFAFTYLVKENKETWEELSISLNLLYKNILRKLFCNFKIIIFYEGKPSKDLELILNNLKENKNIRIILKKISLFKYVKRKEKDNFIKEFPHAADCRLITSLGYRDMCKFFAYDIFLDEQFDDVEYFVRLDTDSFFLYTNKKFIYSLQNFSYEYGYIKNTIQFEDKAVSLGFGKLLYNYFKDNKNFTSLNKDYISLCQEATLKPKIYYTNFEIIKLTWVKSKSHTKLMKKIIKSKGIYNYRWGDALIRYYAINLLGASKKSLRGCLYKHSGLYDSRNILRRFLTKSYSKFRKKLYKNNYEKRLSKIDKIFLGFYI